MSGSKFDPYVIDVWEHADESTVAIRADECTADEAIEVYMAQYGIRREDARYRGIEVWNLPEREGLIGRRRRCHVVTSELGR